MLESLINIMVVSVSTSHLIHSRITEPEMDKLDAVKAGIGKKFLGVPKFASRWGVLAELGWSSVTGQVVQAKLGFYGRIRCSEEGGILLQVYATFYDEMEKGGIQNEKLIALGGFLIQVKEWLSTLGLIQFWGKGHFPKKKKWNEIVKPKIIEWDRARWKTWRQGKRTRDDWLVANKDIWGIQEYVEKTTRKDRQLIAAVRMLVAGADEPADAEVCRMCGGNHFENTEHLVLHCFKWEAERRRITGPGKSSISANWKILTNGTPLSVAFLRNVRRDFEEVHGKRFVPWVSVLGKDSDRGGVESLVQEVSKWLGTQK
jgi:hypothetical protein